MATTDADRELASALSEPPRKRRAAALAAQKNWQMLNKPDDDIIDLEDDLIEVTHTVPNTGLRTSLPNTNSYVLVNTSNKRTSLPNTSTTLLHRNHKVIDKDYSPAEDLELIEGYDQRLIGMKAKKTFPTPTAPTVRFRPPIVLPRTQSLVLQNRIIHPNLRLANPVVRTIRPAFRPLATKTVLIETDKSKRVIARTDGSKPRKAFVNKLHPSEPLNLPIVEGETEEIVGTYDDNQEMIVADDRDYIEEESLIMLCESEEKTIKHLNRIDEPKDDDIEVIEIIGQKDVVSRGNTPKPQMRTTMNSLKSRQNDKIKGHLDSVIGSLEINCENCDDEYTDGLCVDCEEDILSEIQWKESIDSSKIYKQYSKVVSSTKNVKFLPEAEVNDPIGITTTTISETTHIVTKPTPSRPIRSNTRQNTIQSQTIRAPIPSVVNPIPTSVHPNFAIFPIASTSGATNPLILAPQTLVGASGLSPTLRLYLQPRSSATQPTYVVLSQQSSNVVPTQSIIVSNSNHLMTSASNHNFRLTTPISSPRIMRPRIIARPSIQASTAPIVSRAPAPAIRGRPPRYRAESIIANHSNGNQTNKTSNNQLFECLTNFKTITNPMKKINTGTVLTIKPLPFSWPSNIDDLISSLIKLDNALMKEKFKEAPIAWMVTNQLIVPPKCKYCPIGVCNQVSKSVNAKNEYWHCNNNSCNRSYLIDRPRIFVGPKFDIPVSKLLFLIYYWSIQVDVEDLIKTGQIEMGTDKIYNVWNRLQKVCSHSLQSKDSMLGSSNREVEIASIQIGRFHVLGAMEAVSHRTKLAVIPLSEIIQQNGKNAVMLPFVRWIQKTAIVKTCEAKFLGLRDYGYRVICQTKNDFVVNNKNLSLNTISGYLIHHFQRFFKDFDLNGLTHDILSNILDELLWRERFGTNPFNAFYNIIKHISEQCALKKPEYDISVTQRAPPPQTGLRTPPATTYSRTQNRPQTTNQLDETNSVFVEEYYYSSLKLKESVAKTISQEDGSKDGVQCHLCQMFFDNILIIKHLLEHLEKERGGRVRKGDNNETECKHCLRFYGNRALHFHEELANLKLVPFSCRICLLPLYARQPFIGHMKTSHFSGEMPYYCDICSYHSSFQKSLFDHFEASHSNCSQILCPFCIRVFDGSKARAVPASQFLYRHLTTHYAVASVYDCDKCVLTFTSKEDLMEHCFKGHNPSNTVDEKFEVSPYMISEEEKKLCVRAREQELFTPFLPNFGNDSNQENVVNKEPTADKESEANKEDNVESLEISCEPNIEEFLSIEPDIEIEMTEETEPTQMVSFVEPIDCEYSDDQLKTILTNSFDIDVTNKPSEEQMEVDEHNPNSEPIPEPSTSEIEFILHDQKRVVCFECKTEITSDHMLSKMVCNECNFTTHCKTAFESHTAGAHTFDSTLNKSLTVFELIPELVSYQINCSDCDFSSTDGNRIAKHMIESNHFDIVCKPFTDIKL